MFARLTGWLDAARALAHDNLHRSVARTRDDLALCVSFRSSNFLFPRRCQNVPASIKSRPFVLTAVTVVFNQILSDAER
jgi:hypothetical protein